MTVQPGIALMTEHGLTDPAGAPSSSACRSAAMPLPRCTSPVLYQPGRSRPGPRPRNRP